MKQVILTFDDRVASQLEAVALLKEYGFGATFYINRFEEKRPEAEERPLMTAAELRQLAGAGFELGNHSVNHPDFSTLDDAEIEREIDGMERMFAAAGLPITRAYVGSYTALVNLYAKQANAALVHLYDQRTNAYNVPSVQRIAPGMPVVVIRLLKRKQGFIVQAGNPKKLTTWGGLLREGVRLTNRERGCGTRVLLDEKLLSLEARPEMVEGYDLECATGLEAATLVSKGCADVTIGIERLAKELPGLAFVPLQTEWLDIAVEKSQRTAPLVREIRKIAESKSFRYAIDAIEGYEAANTGAIVYES